MKRSLLVAVLTFLFALTSMNVKAQDWGGAGKPFPIKDKNALIALKNCINGSGNTFYFHTTDSTFTMLQPQGNYVSIDKTSNSTHYKLMSDVDLNPGKNVSACDGDATGLTAWAPFNSFKGHLDGGCHIISGVLVIDLSDKDVGFVKELPENASIKNLGIVNSYFSGKKRVGGIAGYMTTSTVTHCFVDAVIVGFMEPSIDGNLNPVGGIVGEATTGATIDTCYTSGSITSRKGLLGGICGNGSVITLKSCYSSMVINYETSQVGGIAGDLPLSANNAGSTVINCYYDK